MIPISYSLRSLTVRKSTTAAAAGGIALVVFVFSAVLMAGNSVTKTFGRGGSPDVVVVLRDGSDAELSSNVEEPDVGLILASPEVARRADGSPDGTAELVGVLALDKSNGDGVSNLQIRGVSDHAFDFRPSVRIVEGRRARPGADEVVIGAAVRGRFRGVDLGQTFEVRRNRPVEVVGIFEADGSSYESEVWGDVETVRAAFGRPALYSSVRARLRSPSAFDAFRASVEGDRRLGVSAARETDFLAKQSENTASFVMGMGFLIAVFFSMGAIIGAMITMYAAVANRTREIGTLRALGFPKRAILTSFVIEAVLLALGGGLVGAAGSLCLGLVRFSLVNFQTWSEMVFSFEPTPAIIGGSLLFAVTMGLVGGAFPAFRAARVDVLTALRS
jgi:putative ABC transport system permease protein